MESWLTLWLHYGTDFNISLFFSLERFQCGLNGLSDNELTRQRSHLTVSEEEEHGGWWSWEFKQERCCPIMSAGCLSARLPVCLLSCVRPPSWPWSMTEEWWSGPTLAPLQGEKTNTEHVMMSAGNTPLTSPVCVCLFQSVHRQQSHRQTDSHPRQDLLLQVSPAHWAPSQEL